MKPVKDEYDWPVYTQEYSEQVDEMEKTAGPNGSDFIVNDWHIDVEKNTIDFKNNLHGNWKQLYTSVFECKPSSVFECGCGGMYHLKNIGILFPNTEIHGVDLLQTQIDFGKKKFNIPQSIMKNIRVRNFATPDATKDLDQYDFVYSHAVMLHLSHVNAIQFLKNMTKIAKKHVFFIEGPQHNYFQLLDEIGETNNFNIEQLVKYNKNAFLLTRK